MSKSRAWALRVSVAIVLAGTGLATLGIVATAANRPTVKKAAPPKNASVKQIRDRIAKAKQALAIAEAQLQTGGVQIDMARKAVADAKAAASDTKKARELAAESDDFSPPPLGEIEKELLDAQGSESDVGEAKKRVAEAQQDLDKLIQAKRSEKDTEYIAARNDLDEARVRYRRLKKELYKSDPHWVEVRSKMSLAPALGPMGPVVSETAAKRQMAMAQQAANTARQIIADGKAKLRAMGLSDADPPPAKKPPPPKKK